MRRGVKQTLGVELLDRHIDLNDLGFLERNDNYRIRGAHTRTASNLGWARDNQFDVRGFAQKNGDGLFTGGGAFLSDRLTLNHLGVVTVRANFFARASRLSEKVARAKPGLFAEFLPLLYCRKNWDYDLL